MSSASKLVAFMPRTEAPKIEGSRNSTFEDAGIVRPEREVWIKLQQQVKK